MLGSACLPGTRGVRSLTTEVSRSGPPDAFGPFRVLHQIGAGTLGPVFRAYDPDLDRLVAVKLFSLPLPPDQVHRLTAEFDVLVESDLSHPAIAAPISTGITGVAAYLAQDFVLAEGLDRVAGGRGRVAPSEAVRIVTQLAAALDSAARTGVYHGSLHTRDVLVSESEVRLTGLGVAQALERIGVTPPIRRPFTAPERVVGKGWDFKADVFALAALAHELLWGKRVTASGEAAAGALSVLPGGDLDLLRFAFARGLAEDPSERFEKASAFAEELAVAFSESVAAEEADERPVAVPPGPVPGRLPLAEAAHHFPGPRAEDAGREDVPAGTPPTPEELLAFAAEAPIEGWHEMGPTRLGTEEAEDEPATGQRYLSFPSASETDDDRPLEELQPLGAAVFVSPDDVRSTLWPVVVAAVIFATMGFAAGHAVATLGGITLFGGGALGPAVGTRAAPAVPPARNTEPIEVQPVADAPVARPAEDAAVGPVDASGNTPAIPPIAAGGSLAVSEVRSGASPALPPSLTIESRPSGAAVFVDGRQIGRTPLVTESVTVGEHDVRLTLDGYRDWTTSMAVSAGSNRIAASLQP